MKASLIVLFKDEVDYAEKTIVALHTTLFNEKIDFEIIAVDDSTDGTWEVLNTLQSRYPNMLIVKGASKDGDSGYGKALKKGFSVASGDIIIPFNGDLSDAPKDALTYISFMKKGYDMVVGSRFMQGAAITNCPLVKGFISRLGNQLLQILFHTRCSDITNSFKAYKKEILDKTDMTENGYSINMEIALSIIKKKHNYTCIPVNWSGRKYGVSKMDLLRTIPSYLKTAIRVRFC